jgi:argininosuccinate lyase
MKTCVERRNTTGAPGPKAMEEEIERNRKYLAEK